MSRRSRHYKVFEQKNFSPEEADALVKRFTSQIGEHFENVVVIVSTVKQGKTVLNYGSTGNQFAITAMVDYVDTMLSSSSPVEEDEDDD